MNPWHRIVTIQIKHISGRPYTHALFIIALATKKRRWKGWTSLIVIRRMLIRLGIHRFYWQLTDGGLRYRFHLRDGLVVLHLKTRWLEAGRAVRVLGRIIHWKTHIQRRLGMEEREGGRQGWKLNITITQSAILCSLARYSLPSTRSVAQKGCCSFR